jgi:hypothetical protein
MDGKADVSSRPPIWSLTQVVHLMLLAPDILGIECWASIYFWFISELAEQYFS